MRTKREIQGILVGDDSNVSVIIINGSDAGKTESRQSGPISELRRVTSNPNEYPVPVG